MGRASLTIAVSGEYNGRAMEKARKDLEKMKVTAAAEMGGVAGSFVRGGAAVAEMGGKIYNAGEAMESAGAAATRGITLPLVAAGAACYGLSTDFENAMAKVSTIADTTEVPMEDLRGAIIDLSNDTGIAASDIADNVYNAISAGQKTGDAVAFVGDAARLAKAGFTDSASALDVLTTTMNAYKMEADQTTRVSDVLLMTQNKGKTTVGELASSMGRAIPTASAFGVNLENLAAAYATTTANGIATAESTTYINSMIKELGDTGSEVGKILQDKTGKSFSQLMESGTSLGEALNIVADASAESNKTMYDMFGSAEAAGAAATIAGDGAMQFADNLDAMNGAAGSTDEAFGKMETTTYTVEKAVNKVKNVLIETGDSLVKNLGPAIDGFADGAQELTEWFDGLDEETRDTIVSFAGLAAAVGPVLTVTGKLTKGVGNLTVGFGKGMQKLGAFGAGLGTVKADAAAMTGSVKAGATAAEGLGKAAGTASAGTGLLTKGVNLLTGACKATAIGLVIGLVADLAAQLVGYAQHQQLVADATTGLTGAMGAAEEAYQSYTPNVEAATEAMGDAALSANDCLRSQSDLAKTMNDTWRDYGTNAAMVDSYAQTIQELGDKGDLTAGEQERLKLAVEGFNDATGASVGIIDGQTGQLNMQKDAILEVAEAYKTEARAEAARELYKETTKQLIQDQMSLKQATDELAASEEGWGIWLGDFPVVADEASVKHHELQQNVDDLTAATESAKNTQSDLLNVMAGSQASFDTLDQALEATGINMSDFGDVGEAELQGLQQNFDGTLNSIVSECSAKGVQIPTALADSIRNNSGLPTDAQQVMFDAMVLQMAGGDVKLAAQALGHDIDQGLVDGITGNGDMPKEAIGVLSQETIDKAKEAWESHSPSQVMYRLGGDIDAGLGNGISENTDHPTTAMGSLASLMQNAISGLPGFSRDTGSSSGSNLASSVGSFASAVASSAGSLFSSATGGIAGTPRAFSTTGSSAGTGLSRAIGSVVGSVASSARSLHGSATGGIAGTPGAFKNTGSAAAGGFSAAIGNASAYGSGRSLANTADSGLGSVSAYGTGSNFSRGFANGMGGVNIWSAAYSVGMSALGAIKSALGIASPSREAMAVGEFFGEGAILGMRSTERGIEAESKRMSQAMAIEPPFERGASSGVRSLSAPSRSFSGSSVVHNHYTIGDVTISAASIKEFMTMEQFFKFMARAKAVG